MANDIYYTALETYTYQEDKTRWEKYIEWSKLRHLKELVTLDGMLNKPIFEPNLNSKNDWNYIVTEGEFITMLFTSKDYVLEKSKGVKYFNFLAVIKEPKKVKTELETDFEFVGYELIDKSFEISPLTNCGGFNKTFLPTDINEFGLISDYDTAKKIQKELPINNPTEHHVHCYLFEVWRHKKIGRKHVYK